MKRILVMGALLGLSACGKESDLKPRAGAAMPVKPLTAPVAPTVNSLLDPTPEAVPTRTDEPLTKSQKRGDDRFDLPPPG
jgi:hypothetical protein